MKNLCNKEFIHRSYFKSHFILMVVSILVGVISLARCPSSVRYGEVDTSPQGPVFTQVDCRWIDHKFPEGAAIRNGRQTF